MNSRNSISPPTRYGSAAGSRQGPAPPGGSGELGGAAIPPLLRQETQRQVPGCVLEAGADVDGPDEVVDEPLVLRLPTRRPILAPGSSTAPGPAALRKRPAAPVHPPGRSMSCWLPPQVPGAPSGPGLASAAPIGGLERPRSRPLRGRPPRGRRRSR